MYPVISTSTEQFQPWPWIGIHRAATTTLFNSTGYIGMYISLLDMRGHDPLALFLAQLRNEDQAIV